MKRIKSIYRFLVLTGCIVMTSCSNYLDIQPVGKVIPNTLEEYRALMTTASVSYTHLTLPTKA